MALIGEPSGMGVINGHKRGTGFAVHVKGYEVHSSLLPYGVSAIMEAARLIQWINDRNTALQAAAGAVGVLSAVHDAACRHDSGRHGQQHHGGGLPVRGGDAGVAGRGYGGPWPSAFVAAAMRLDAAMKARHAGAGVS